MSDQALPVHEFFAAIYGYFPVRGDGRPSALHEAVSQALTEQRHAHLALTLMDHLAGDVEVQWVREDERRAGGPSFAMPTDTAGGLDLVALARARPDVYAEAFQVAVTRLLHRERPAYDAYFALVLDVFEGLFGPGSAPRDAAPAA
jgi:hypothetical protein